ncbi:MAG: hypothetical protein NUV47_00125 [Patescibacteria group bacterium]|nr:hypothetical protein [Patescibacteria group bacterium]
MNYKKGLIKMVVVIVIALLILSYYGFDIEKTIKNPLTQKNWDFLKTSVVHIWDISVDLIHKITIKSL